MKTATLAVCHIKKGDSFLFRKKPDGSEPYKETWYSFGVEITPEITDIEEALVKHVHQITGAAVAVTERLWWDSETKLDQDGEQAFFVYLHSIAEYVSGELTPTEGIEKLQWIGVDELDDFPIVPPSRAFLDKYLP